MQIDCIFSQIFQARSTQTMLVSVTVSHRLCLTEARSEMKEGVLGSLPNDLPQQLFMGAVCLCILPCQTFLLPQLPGGVYSLRHDPGSNAYTPPTC